MKAQLSSVNLLCAFAVLCEFIQYCESVRVCADIFLIVFCEIVGVGSLSAVILYRQQNWCYVYTAMKDKVLFV